MWNRRIWAFWRLKGCHAVVWRGMAMAHRRNKPTELHRRRQPFLMKSIFATNPGATTASWACGQPLPGDVAVGVSNQPPMSSIWNHAGTHRPPAPVALPTRDDDWMRATGAINNANASLIRALMALHRHRRLPTGQPPPPKMRTLPGTPLAKARMARKIRRQKGAKIYASARRSWSR